MAYKRSSDKEELPLSYSILHIGNSQSFMAIRHPNV